MRANVIAHDQQEDLERGLLELERAMEDGGVGDKKELLDAHAVTSWICPVKTGLLTNATRN